MNDRFYSEQQAGMDHHRALLKVALGCLAAAVVLIALATLFSR